MVNQLFPLLILYSIQKGKSLEELIHEEDLERTRTLISAGGPRTAMRYVKLDNGIVLDMRHFLVLGRVNNIFGSELAGIGVELMQLSKRSWRSSAFDLQDLLSNYYGGMFFDKFNKKKSLSAQLDCFFKGIQ